MNIHNIHFYGELTKIVYQLSPNTIRVLSGLLKKFKCVCSLLYQSLSFRYGSF